MNDFKEFQKWFNFYQAKFGLTGYKVYFKHEPLENSFADITFNLLDMVATVRLNSVLLDKDKGHSSSKTSAKHEALHLLVGRLEQNGRYRYTSENELYETTEELVRKLEGLIE